MGVSNSMASEGDFKSKLALKSPSELKAAMLHSVRGFWAVFLEEKAFRMDLLVFVICVVVALVLPDVSWGERALMVYVAFIPLVAELMNTAIEKTIDRISTEYNALSGLAKDIGSALVLVSFVGAGLCWTIVLTGWIVRRFLS